MTNYKGYIESINPLETGYGLGMRLVVFLNSVNYKVELTPNELVDRIRKFRPYMEDGVTFAGDVKQQEGFLLEELKLCKKAGFKTCVYTNAEMTYETLKYIDSIIGD